MNADDSLRVCRLAKALSPAQAIDEYQPEAWHLVLRHWRYCDATAALELLGGEQEWIHVSHIVKRIKAIRRQRVLDYGTLPDPPKGLDPDDTAAYERHIADATRAIADGTMVKGDETPTAVVTGRRDVVRELGQVGQPVEKAPRTATAPARAMLAEARARAVAAEANKRDARLAHDANLAAARDADRKARESAGDGEVGAA